MNKNSNLEKLIKRKFLTFFKQTLHSLYKHKQWNSNGDILDDYFYLIFIFLHTLSHNHDTHREDTSKLQLFPF